MLWCQYLPKYLYMILLVGNALDKLVCTGNIVFHLYLIHSKEKIIIYIIHIGELRTLDLDDGRPSMCMCMNTVSEMSNVHVHMI